MSIKLIAREPHTTLEIGADSDDELCISANFRGEKYHLSVTVKTRDLVMAIKEVEDARDAKRTSAGSDSAKPGSPYDDPVLERTLCEAEIELGTLCRKAGPEFIYSEKITKLWRSIYRTTDPKEIKDTIDRIKEIYAGPDIPKAWGIKVDHMAPTTIVKKYVWE